MTTSRFPFELTRADSFSRNLDRRTPERAVGGHSGSRMQTAVCDGRDEPAPRSRVLRCAAIVAMALLAACGERGGPDRAERHDTPVPVLVTEVRPAQATETVRYAGEVKPRTEVPLSFRVGGKVIERTVELGSTLRRGDVVARLDSQDLQLGSRAAEAEIAAAQTEYEQQRLDLERFSGLRDKNFISPTEFERRQRALDVAAAKVDRLKSELAISRNRAAYATLRSDDDGVVTSVEAQPGQVVAAGQPIVRVARPGDKDVHIGIPENRLALLREAGDVEITLWALSGRRYRGRLREVSPVADPATRTYLAKIELIDADDKVALGMTANVTLRGQADAAMAVPESAIYRSGDDTAVWVVGNDGRVALRPVRVAAIAGEDAHIAGGLASGEWVVSAGVQKLFAGQRVRRVIATAP